MTEWVRGVRGWTDGQLSPRGAPSFFPRDAGGCVPCSLDKAHASVDGQRPPPVIRGPGGEVVWSKMERQFGFPHDSNCTTPQREGVFGAWDRDSGPWDAVLPNNRSADLLEFLRRFFFGGG